MSANETFGTWLGYVMVNERSSRMVVARETGESVVVGVEMTKVFVDKWKEDQG